MPLQMACHRFGLRTEAVAGVDVLSHKKKAMFWRNLVKLFPNIIDYLCNPNVDQVASRANKRKIRSP